MRYDVVVIGGGPGGYVAAIRMAQLGLKIALVEKAQLGGVCLHWGCVPTKALYAATRLVARARVAATHGIAFGEPQIELGCLATWKEGVVRRLADGVAGLLKSSGVTVIAAEGRLAGPGHIALSSGETLEAERIVLATGSSPVEIPGLPFSHPAVWSSSEALALTEIPKRLLVVGAGVIGLELATIYRRLGSAVTVIELLAEILPGIDLGRRGLSLLRRSLAVQGIDVRLSTVAASLEATADGVLVRAKGGESLAADRVLVAVGRRPNSAGIGLETVGVAADRRGFVLVDEHLETSARGVYAIGDLVPGPMLAHKASAEGLKLAAWFVGEEIPLDYALVPQAIFTDPEVALAGLSEERAREAGHEVTVGRCPYAVLGKAQGMDEPEGFFQVVGEKKTGGLLGAQVIGAEASDLISEVAIALQNGLSLGAMANTIHPHPTLSEGWKEAAENALGRAIHTANR
jgi:dihydrolipoamide dehydrogenase